jgi:hypothetical protein
MSDNEPRGCMQTIVAMIAAGGVGFILGWSAAMPAGINAAIMSGGDGGAYGLFLGWIGVSSRTLGRANLAGSLYCGIFGGLIALLASDPSFGIGNRLWLLAGLSSFGSICAQVGAIVGGRATASDKSSTTMRFTLRQFLAFFIPVAVYFGFVTAHFHK